MNVATAYVLLNNRKATRVLSMTTLGFFTLRIDPSLRILIIRCQRRSAPDIRVARLFKYTEILLFSNKLHGDVGIKSSLFY